MLAVAVFFGAGLGGVARYAIGTWFEPSGAGIPWPTFVINVSGSLLLGFVHALLEGGSAAPEWRIFLGVGVLGGYTTFSTFSHETLRLIQLGEWQRALAYAVASVILGLGAAFVGIRLATLLIPRA